MLKVSVIIPLYNKGPHIRRTINSVLAQTIQDFEVIVVDGDSQDNGPEIVQHFVNLDSRIRLVQQKGKGVSDARNQGIYESSSDFIAFLDADDEWMPNHLETLLKLREEHPEAGAYTTAYLLCTSEKRTDPEYRAIPPEPWEGILPNYFRAALGSSPPVWTSAVGVPKEVFTKVGYFPKSVWWGEDLDLWGRIALKYPVAFSWNGKAIYHLEATNRICNKKIPIHEHPFVISSKEYIREGEVPVEILGDLKEYVAFLQIMTASYHVCAGNNKFSLQILKSCETKVQIWKKRKWLLLAYTPRSIITVGRKLKQFI